MTTDRPGRSRRLLAALDALWSDMADDYGLLPDLAGDAVLARADRGEFLAAVPRLVQLLVGHELPIDLAADVVARLGDHPWETERLVVIQEIFDAWWLETLMLEDGEHTPPYTPEVVLGVLAGYDAPMVRWFEPWIGELDGAGASHLVSIVVHGPDGLTASAWEGKTDQADQLFGWARTETVVNGLALVGATHVEPERLSKALDLLIA